MKAFLVGGAVRDLQRGQKAQDRDYVVVGMTPEQMLALGFKKVGRDFPVFLHPQTQEEYALARTERKVAPGHQGFVCYASPDVTLEQDLLRRDLTINAMAMDDAGHLIDPYGGLLDLQNQCLRHVSPAFIEDPLRILRLARFWATFGPTWHVAPETEALIITMIKKNGLQEISIERLKHEIDKAMQAAYPALFWQALRAWQGLDFWGGSDENRASWLAWINRCPWSVIEPALRWPLALSLWPGPCPEGFATRVQQRVCGHFKACAQRGPISCWQRQDWQAILRELRWERDHAQALMLLQAYHASQNPTHPWPQEASLCLSSMTQAVRALVWDEMESLPPSARAQVREAKVQHAQGPFIQKLLMLF